MNAGEGLLLPVTYVWHTPGMTVSLSSEGRGRWVHIYPATCLLSCRCRIWKLWVWQQFGHGRLQ